MLFPSPTLPRTRRAPARPRSAVAAAVLSIALVAAPAPSRAQAQSSPCVSVGQPPAILCGAPETVAVSVDGTTDSVSVSVFQGIRYAAPPVNTLRWQPPQTAPLSTAASPAGSDTLSATSFGAICPQIQADTVAGSEDCLFLNVWSPAGASSQAPVPVMVFIHGGAFIEGSGSLSTYDGSYLAASGDVVIVTLNYRLGALGFLAARTLSGSFSASGNFGLLDQQAALQWVQGNIGSFGGDPARVTIFGESAGAMSVGFHLFSAPGSNGLFHAAIMESNPMGYRYRETLGAYAQGALFLGALCALHNPPSKDCSPWLRDSATAKQIVIAQSGVALFGLAVLRVDGLPGVLPWTPFVDGNVVTGQPYAGYARSAMTPKPFMFGMNEDEGVLFAALAQSLLGAFPRSYDSIVAYAFPGNQNTILQYTAGDLRPYADSAHALVANLDSAGSALAELITDFGFNCGNLAAADKAYSLNNDSPGQPPIFAYRFDHDTLFFNAFSKVTTACDAIYDVVCHGAELPYVFNTLASVQDTTPGSPTPTAVDVALAQSMSAAWTSFARNPSAAPAANWQPYTGSGGQLYYWGGPDNGTMVGGLESSANCTTLWYTIPPLSNAASSIAQGTGTAPRPAGGGGR